MIIPLIVGMLFYVWGYKGNIFSCLTLDFSLYSLLVVPLPYLILTASLKARGL